MASLAELLQELREAEQEIDSKSSNLGQLRCEYVENSQALENQYYPLTAPLHAVVFACHDELALLELRVAWLERKIVLMTQKGNRYNEAADTAPVKKELKDALQPTFEDAFRAMEAAAPGSIEAAMWKESVLTLSEIVRSDMPLSSIVSPGFTFVNKQLAEHYGLPADGLGEDFKRVEMPSRGGVLQQGSWLTLSAASLKTSPMHRGRLVQDRLLCKVIPPPDSTLFEQIQQVANSIPADATVKQRVDQHRQAGPQCFGCHQFMDPIGLSLEGFDQFGKVRKTYSDGRAVETNSELLGTPSRPSRTSTGSSSACPTTTAAPRRSSPSSACVASSISTSSTRRSSTTSCTATEARSPRCVSSSAGSSRARLSARSPTGEELT